VHGEWVRANDIFIFWRRCDEVHRDRNCKPRDCRGGVLDSARRRAKRDAGAACAGALDTNAVDDLARTTHADRTAGEHPGADTAANSAADGHRAVCAGRDEQRPLHDNARDAEQHDLGNGPDIDACGGTNVDTRDRERGESAAAGCAGSRPERQRGAGSACELAGAQHGAGAQHDQPAVDNGVHAAAGDVACVSRPDHRGQRRHAGRDPAAVHAGHGSGLDDHTAGDADHAVNDAADAGRAVHGSTGPELARDPGHDGAGHVESARDSESVAESMDVPAGGVIVSRSKSMWVRRLWPEERSAFERPVGADPESHGASHDVKSTASRIRMQAKEWVTLRWPCWPATWLNDPESREPKE